MSGKSSGSGHSQRQRKMRTYGGSTLQTDLNRFDKGCSAHLNQIIVTKDSEQQQFQGVIGAPGTIRTSGPQIRSLMLYPAELRARNDASLV
jgi:hypothetical protein